MRRATRSSLRKRRCGTFQSTLSVRRATRTGCSRPYWHRISIHALREESDVQGADGHGGRHSFQSTLSVRRATLILPSRVDVSIFQSTLSVRRATSNGSTCLRTSIFQSTLSVRRATFDESHRAKLNEFQSTLSVRRATFDPFLTSDIRQISIHALREESDHSRAPSTCRGTNFNPRSP